MKNQYLRQLELTVKLNGLMGGSVPPQPKSCRQTPTRKQRQPQTR
ncbi:MAG: hypothetical protein ACLUEJ_06875 [Clostridium sp.]